MEFLTQDLINIISSIRQDRAENSNSELPIFENMLNIINIDKKFLDEENQNIFIDDIKDPKISTDIFRFDKILTSFAYDNEPNEILEQDEKIEEYIKNDNLIMEPQLIVVPINFTQDYKHIDIEIGANNSTIESQDIDFGQAKHISNKNILEDINKYHSDNIRNNDFSRGKSFLLSISKNQNEFNDIQSIKESIATFEASSIDVQDNEYDDTFSDSNLDYASLTEKVNNVSSNKYRFDIKNSNIDLSNEIPKTEKTENILFEIIENSNADSNKQLFDESRQSQYDINNKKESVDQFSISQLAGDKNENYDNIEMIDREKKNENTYDNKTIPEINPNISIIKNDNKSENIDLDYKASPNDQIKAIIVKAIQSDNNEINFELTPASLGKLTIKIELNNNQTFINITAERAETFHLLQNDVKSLEAKLNDAGIKIDNNQMSFNLNNQQSSNHQNHQLAGQYYKTERSEDTEEVNQTDRYDKKVSNKQLDIFI